MMDREEEKALFEHFGLPYYENHSTERLLIAIMQHLHQMELRTYEILELLEVPE